MNNNNEVWSYIQTHVLFLCTYSNADVSKTPQLDTSTLVFILNLQIINNTDHNNHIIQMQMVIYNLK